MKKTLISAFAVFTASAFVPAQAGNHTVQENIDSLRVVDIEEVVIVASPKVNNKFRQQPTAVSLFSQNDMLANRITSLKRLTAATPNFFMPDYGSKLTSAIYIRGIGSRINTPAVGLYVDNVPYLDKSAFDFNFTDIDRIDVLRGPQGTLYGRNTMGGLIHVYTPNPFYHQGTDVKLSASTGNNSYSATLTHYHRISDKFAFSAGGFYQGARGFFKNETLNKWADPVQSGGGRLRGIYKPMDNLKFDLSLNYEYSDEGGYAYGLADKTTNKIGSILNNDESKYRRGLFNAGLNVEYRVKDFIINSITGYQNLNDRMFMDQDFTAANIYTLEQKQKLNSLTQEFTIKNKPGKDWQWTTGISGYYQSLNTQAPVTFKDAGMTMLSTQINAAFPDLSDRGMSMILAFKDSEMKIPTNFDTPVLSGAIFHQSTFNNLFIKGLSFTAGLRLEHEHTKLNYASSCSTMYDFTFKMGQAPIQLTDQNAVSELNGVLQKDYTQLLPKFALKYDFDTKNNVYVSVAKGYRSGGYNLQMFSDIASSDLRNIMMEQVKNGCIEKVEQLSAMLGEQRVEMIKGYISQSIPTFENADATNIVYKPEYSWNYEIGSHLTLLDNRLQADLAAFYMDTRDQQLTRFVNSGLGRIMVNAGRSRSYGIEANLIGQVTDNLSANLSYGFTKATFKEYDGGVNSQGESIDYNGNYVPFVPRHTLNLGAAYTFRFKNAPIESLTLNANYQGVGKIYWTEANNAMQSYYGTYNGRVSAKFSKVQLDLWVENLFNKKYNTFYFESMGNGFAQISKPRYFGVDLRLNL